MPAFSSRYMNDERNRLRGVASGTIDRSGTLEAAGMTPSGAFQTHPGFGDVPQPALSNAAPPTPPAGQAQPGYPPASALQASPQEPGGAAPFNPSRRSALGGGTYKPGDPVKKPQNTTKDLFKNADPLAIEDALETSVAVMDRTAKTNPEAFKQVEAALTLKGVDTRKAFEDLRDNLMEDAAKRRNARSSKVYNEKEFKKRWKNIFNIIPEDRMGMFLFDFGLRMLAASNTPGGAGGHAGMAGMGALQSMQGRMDIENQQALEDQRFANEEARAIMGMEQDAQAGALRSGELALSQEWLRQEIAKGNRIDPEKIVWTTKGAMYDDGSGLKPLRDAQGGALQPHERFGKGGAYDRPYESDIRYNRLRQAGYDHKRATDLLEGAPTEAEVRVRAADDFSSLADKRSTKYPSPIDGTPKYLTQFNEKERQTWINQRVADVLGTPSAAGTAMPQRPEGWEDYD